VGDDGGKARARARHQVLVAAGQPLEEQLHHVVAQRRHVPVARLPVFSCAVVGHTASFGCWHDQCMAMLQWHRVEHAGQSRLYMREKQEDQTRKQE